MHAFNACAECTNVQTNRRTLLVTYQSYLTLGDARARVYAQNRCSEVVKPVNRTIPCPWRTTCPCTHTDGCVAGWIDAEDGQTTSPCPMCRPDLYSEMRRRRHGRGDNTEWIRHLLRPHTDMRSAR